MVFKTGGRVIIVEDEALFRQLLHVALSHQLQLQVVGTFADGETALSEAPYLSPEVALLDIYLGRGMDGIETGLQLRQKLPGLGIVLLSNHRDPRFLSTVPPAAISGWSYLLKQSVGNLLSLGLAIQSAAAGLVVLDPELIEQRPRLTGHLARLKPRQQEILGLIAQGLTNAAIAEKLHLTEKTIENHIGSMYQELGIAREDPSIQARVHAVLHYLRGTWPGGWEN